MRERGWDGVPNSDEGSDTVVLLVYLYGMYSVKRRKIREIISCFAHLTLLCKDKERYLTPCIEELKVIQEYLSSISSWGIYFLLHKAQMLKFDEGVFTSFLKVGLEFTLVSKRLHMDGTKDKEG